MSYLNIDNKKIKINLNGWKRQSVDDRDYSFKVNRPYTFQSLPSSVDNRSICSPVQDQGRLGSCTAHMFAGMVEANQIKIIKTNKVSPDSDEIEVIEENQLSLSEVGFFKNIYNFVKYEVTFIFLMLFGWLFAKENNFNSASKKTSLVRPSRLFHYYVTRKLRGTISEDSGASIRESIKAGALFGAAKESLWSYNILNYKKYPPKDAWSDASGHKVKAYYAISDGDTQTMKEALAGGYLVGFGFLVFSGLMNSSVAKSGLVTKPKSNETCIGGHAVVLVGYDNNKIMPDGSKGAFLVRNSWGTSWGIGGYFWMSYNYVGDSRLSNDFWVIESSPM